MVDGCLGDRRCGRSLVVVILIPLHLLLGLEPAGGGRDVEIGGVVCPGGVRKIIHHSEAVAAAPLLAGACGRHGRSLAKLMIAHWLKEGRLAAAAATTACG